MYKNRPLDTAIETRKTDCAGYFVGIRNVMLAALTEAVEIDFRNSGDRLRFGSKEKAMWGLLNYREVSREEVLEDIVQQTYKALYGNFGSLANLPHKVPEVSLAFGASPEVEGLKDENVRLRKRLRQIRGALTVLFDIESDEE